MGTLTRIMIKKFIDLFRREEMILKKEDCEDCQRANELIKELRKELYEMHAFVYKMKTIELMEEIVKEKSSIWAKKHEIRVSETRITALEAGYDIEQLAKDRVLVKEFDNK